MRRGAGFTLLELLLVVSIIGVLTTMAVPQYLKTVERVRMIEAMIMLEQLRSAQIRYRAQAGKFSKLVSLDVSPTVGTGCVKHYVLRVDQTGKISGQGCQQAS